MNWEYRVKALEMNPSRSAAVRLNSYGERGWELVAIDLSPENSSDFE
jgi:hypothetical protein